ncbi:MAG: trigger factor [Prevotellaceae bacterium]|nr:trigger factor [Prevotellaceae bacterium]
MDTRFEKTGDGAGEITVTVTKADYAERVEKELRELRRKSRMPGFRPGQAPVGLLRKLYGQAVTLEQVNSLVGERLFAYIKESKLGVLGEPLPSETKLPPDDWQEQESVDFVFDVALAPEFDAKLSSKDKVAFYRIEVSEEMVDQQVQTYQGRAGEYKQVDEYQPKDMVKGTLTELTEGGLTVEDAVMLPDYMKGETEKAKFEGAKKGETLTLNLSAAYGGSEVELSSLLKITKEEAALKTGDFSFEIKEMTRFEPAPLGQELFDNVFGKDACQSEADFRARIKESLETELRAQSEQRFMLDLREHLLQRIGTLEFSDTMLRRIIKANHKEEDKDTTDEEFAKTKQALTWQLALDQLVEQFGIKVETDDVKETAKQMTRLQFAQYGMGNVSDDILEKYSEGMLQNKEQRESLVERTIERKVRDAALSAVTLSEKAVSLEEFHKLFEE